MCAQKEKGNDWDELMSALRGVWNKKTDSTKELKVTFNKNLGRNTKISLYIEGIDNIYDEEHGWAWDIFLKADGTWYIS